MKQMGYDRAMIVFSPEGRMYQIEYARKAVERAGTAVGVVFDGGAVLVAIKSLQKLMVAEGTEKIVKIDDHIGASFCGIAADGRVLIDYARVRAQVNRITYNEPIDLTALVKDISDRKQRFTQMGGIRPYGVSLLMMGMNSHPEIFETDPSGTLRQWKAHAIGRGSKESRDLLIKDYKDSMTKEAAIQLAVKALAAGEKSLTSKNTEISVVENGKFSILNSSERKQYL